MQAIVKSNGWPEETAALQLFVHLKGEALNVALLLAKEERDSWTGLVDGLAAYYQSPGRLAGLRRRFANASRQPGLDPATYATNLGMLAIQGFSDMGEQARDMMIWDKLIAGQEQRALRQQLDGFSHDTPIEEIVDSCRVWESHSDSNWIPRERYEPEVGSRDSQAWEQREAEGAIGRREREAEREKRVEIGRMLHAVQSSVEEARARERNGVPTGGPACGLDRSDGHGVNRRPRVGAVQLQQITTGWPHGPKGRNRVNNKGRKLKKSPGNERRSERGGQPLGPLRIKAPLTLVGAPARIRKGDPRDIEMDPQPMGHPTPASRRLDGERRPARDILSVSEGNRNVRTRGVQEPVATPLSPLAEIFNPRPTSEEQQPRSSYTDNGLDWSLARTGSSKVETTWNNTKRKIATIGKAGPIETGEPVAMADVAESPRSAGTRAGGPVVAGTQFTAVADRTGASGLGETGEPVVTEMRIQTGIDVADASGPAATGAGGSVGVKRNSDRLVGLPRPVARPEPEPVVRSWPERGSWPLRMYMPRLKTERTTHRAVLRNLNRSQEQSWK